MAFAGLCAVDRHPEAHRLAIGGWPQHQVKIAGMKAKRNRAVRFVERRGLATDRPVAGEGPVVETAEIAGRIDMGGVADRAARRSEILRSRKADVGLRRLDVGRVWGGLGA